MPLGILLDLAHPMSLVPELANQVNSLPASAVDELRKDVRIRFLYMFPENAELSGLRSTARGLGQLIDLSATESAHLLTEARRVIYKVYIDELGWQFGENTPSKIQRVKAHSVVGSFLPPGLPKVPKPNRQRLELYSCSEDPCSEESSPRQCADMEFFASQTVVPSEALDEQETPMPSPDMSRRPSFSSIYDAESGCETRSRRPSFLKDSECTVMNGVADKFDQHAIWCLAIVNDERFDTKRKRATPSPRHQQQQQQQQQQQADSTDSNSSSTSKLLLKSRVVGCIRILVRENCPGNLLEMEGYLSEKRNQDVLRRLRNLGGSSDPLQRVEFQRLVEMNRLAILKEYRGLSLSDDLFGMVFIYASERGSSVLATSSYELGYSKLHRMGKYCQEFGELRYEDHDPSPCVVVVLQLPGLMWLNRVARHVLYAVPRSYWRCANRMFVTRGKLMNRICMLLFLLFFFVMVLAMLL